MVSIYRKAFPAVLSTVSARRKERKTGWLPQEEGKVFQVKILRQHHPGRRQTCKFSSPFRDLQTPGEGESGYLCCDQSYSSFRCKLKFGNRCNDSARPHLALPWPPVLFIWFMPTLSQGWVQTSFPPGLANQYSMLGPPPAPGQAHWPCAAPALSRQ